MVMEMNSVNRNQSLHEVVTSCTGQLKRNRTCVNIDLQKELCKESEEESSTESIGKQPKKVATQSKTSSKNDDDYQDEIYSSEESSYIYQKPK